MEEKKGMKVLDEKGNLSFNEENRARKGISYRVLVWDMKRMKDQ